MVFGSVNTLLFIAWHFETTSTPRNRERNILVLFCPCTPYGSLVSLIGEEVEEEEEERRKKVMILDIFKICFLGFYKSHHKSEDMFVLRRVRAFSSFVGFNVSFHALSPLPSKHFNHPHPYIRDWKWDHVRKLFTLLMTKLCTLRLLATRLGARPTHNQKAHGHIGEQEAENHQKRQY